MSNGTHTGMQARLGQLAENLTSEFAEMGCSVERSCGEVTLVVPPDQLIAVATRLRDDENFRFEELMDVCGVDYSTYGKSEWMTDAAPDMGFGRGVQKIGQLEAMEENRFAAVYHLLSISHNLRLRLRGFFDTAAPLVASGSLGSRAPRPLPTARATESRGPLVARLARGRPTPGRP